jgi:general secretion pathway protein D
MIARFRVLVAAFAGVMLLAGCAGERLMRDGTLAFDQGNYEVALAKLQQAVDADPRNVSYRIDLKARHEEAVQKLVATGDRARSAGDLATAEKAYSRVLAIEAGNDRAQRGLDGVAADRRHAQTIAQAQQEFQRGNLDAAEVLVGNVLNEDPGFPAAGSLRMRIYAARGPVSATPKLKTRDNRPVTLQFRDAPTKAVFEVLSRETGINFIFDKDVKSDGKTTIFVQNVPVEQAIDLVLGQNQLARQVMSENMVMIYPNTPAKQKDYQDEIVRTFYLTTAAPKDVEGLIKTVLDVKTMVVNERAGSITIRDTPEVVRMAEKLVASVDLPEPEVMLEVEVLEIKRSRLQQLGIAYPSQVKFGTTPASGLFVNDIKNQNGSTITVSSLGVTLDALKQDGVSNVLASPRIRARNKEKAKILIGSRVPVITQTTSLIGGSSSPSSNVQYLDVGLTLDVEPTIYADDDVAIKFALEVSTILNTVKVGDTQAYEIGTRNASTLLQLKDGETQILAGLIQDNDTRSAGKVPGLGDIPLLGRLFSDHSLDRSKTEIVLSITPRIIRQRGRADGADTEFWYGAGTRVGVGPLASVSSAAVVAPSRAPPAASPALAAGADSAPAPAPAAYTPTDVSSMAPSGAVTGSSAAEAAAKAPDMAQTAQAVKAAISTPQGPAPKAGLILSGPSDVKVGEEFTVTVELQTDQPLHRVRAQLRFDSATLQLTSAENGTLVPESSGAKVSKPMAGGAMLDATASDEAPIAGSGALMVLRFKALRARPMTAIAAQLAVVGTAGNSQATSTPSPLTLAVGAN